MTETFASTPPGLSIARIRNGIVIDHIRGGKALILSHLLGLDSLSDTWRERISIGINHPSKIGLKDYIKIENFQLSERQLSYVALVSPNATINTIREYAVVDNRPAYIPDEIGDVVRCPDPDCITNHESVRNRFSVVHREPLTLLCRFCELEFYDKLITFRK